ncbi:MAG: substrate-binding domain-containing protein [Lachnospiraceae bacterium]|nr:substrate-binding domain-containing protein [Lachnospiraceae bacterium]
MKRKSKALNSIVIMITTAVIIALTGALVVNFISYSRRFGSAEAKVSYGHYYAMITVNSDSSFWQSVYAAARTSAEEHGDYVEMISENLSRDYSKYELMEIAIASGVDGIIVSADESERMTELINAAASKGIGVVTLYSDNTSSDRLSFVGISNNDLGKLYGELILRLATERVYTTDTIDAVILVDAGSVSTGQNVVLSAVQEAIDGESEETKYLHPPIEISTYTVDPTNEYSAEESIKGLLLRERSTLPEIVVCLGELDTVAVYQMVVDYNEVGLVDILGYYDSEVILNGIDRGVIYATISADTSQMGASSIDALTEYFDYGYTNQYSTAGISIITKDREDLQEGGAP